MALIKLKSCEVWIQLLEICFFSFKEMSSLYKLHIDGTDFYENNKGSKSFKGNSLQNLPSQTEFHASASP